MKSRKIVHALALMIPTSFNLGAIYGCQTTENQNGGKPNQYDDRKYNPSLPGDTLGADSINKSGHNSPDTAIRK